MKGRLFIMFLGALWGMYLLVAHFQGYRAHQIMENKIIQSGAMVAPGTFRIREVNPNQFKVRWEVSWLDESDEKWGRMDFDEKFDLVGEPMYYGLR